MNVMRYDASAVGNHEFNYGLSTLGRAIREASFPFLAANAYLANGARAYPAFVIVKRGDVRVGIVGATTPGSMLWDRDNLRGRVVIRDIVPEVRTAVADARAKGADVIVVTLHSGLTGQSSYDTVTTGLPSENVAARVAREVPGIDLLVFGHSHQELADSVIGTTRLLQPKNWATSVGVAHLVVERSAGQWRIASSRGTTVQSAGHAENPAVVSAVSRAHTATIAYVNRPVGTTTSAWRGDSARVRDTPLMDFVLEVERRTAGADLAAGSAFSLDAALDAGPVTVAELARLYPYDNTLRAVRISGRQLRDYLEFSARYYRTFAGDTGRTTPLVNERIPGYNFDIVAGADYVMDVSRPIGSRVTTLSVKGKPVADTDTFTLALNNYRQSGGGGYAMLQGAPVVYDKQQELRQLLIDEVTRQRTLEPNAYFTPNWRLEPAPAVEAAYLAMHRNTRRAGGRPGAHAARAGRRGHSPSAPDAPSGAAWPHAANHRDERLPRVVRAAPRLRGHPPWRGRIRRDRHHAGARRVRGANDVHEHAARRRRHVPGLRRIEPYVRRNRRRAVQQARLLGGSVRQPRMGLGARFAARAHAAGALPDSRRERSLRGWPGRRVDAGRHVDLRRRGQGRRHRRSRQWRPRARRSF